MTAPLARTIRGLLQPNGTAIISTPFHGYWKNVAIAIGTICFHVSPLWDHGHTVFPGFLAAASAEVGFGAIRLSA
jgi:2-polyprenyl-6-hydroxyphenyl methylase/3-demethylubiquinone-9 3-methyltransferase